MSLAEAGVIYRNSRIHWRMGGEKEPGEHAVNQTHVPRYALVAAGAKKSLFAPGGSFDIQVDLFAHTAFDGCQLVGTALNLRTLEPVTHTDHPPDD